MMVRNEGNAGVYVAGTAGRPLPTPAMVTRNQPTPPKRTGLDWAALTPKCSACGQPSGELNKLDLCPACDPVVAAAALPQSSVPAPATAAAPAEVAAPPATASAGTERPKLPQEGNQAGPRPGVAPRGESSSSTSRRARDAGSSTTGGNTPVAVGGDAPAPAAGPQFPEPAATVPPVQPPAESSTCSTVEARQAPVPGDIPEKEIPADVTPRLRAKVQQVGPRDVVITLRACDTIVTPQVAALLHDLLVALNQQGTPSPDPAAPPLEPVDRHPAGSGTHPRDDARKGKPASSRATCRPSIDPELDAAIAKDYLDGATCPDLATKYGLSERVVHLSLKRTNTPRRRGGAAHNHRPPKPPKPEPNGQRKPPVVITPELDALIAASYKSGLTMQQVATAHDVSKKSVERSLARTCTPSRPRGANHRRTTSTQGATPA